MLTEYELEKMEHYIDQEGRLSNMATSRLIEEVRTLQQQNAQLIEAKEELYGELRYANRFAKRDISYDENHVREIIFKYKPSGSDNT